MMGLYQRLYKSYYRLVHPLHRKMTVRRMMVKDLGRGRPGRVGRALFSYVTGFIRHVTAQYSRQVWDRDDLRQVLEEAHGEKFASHYHHWEAVEIVCQLIERGFVVDCIYDRNGYLLEDVSGYDLILDEWTNLPAWSAQNPRARKWFYATTSHWLYNNTAEMQRLMWLFKRRGVDLAPSYVFPPLIGPGFADVVTHFGNEYSMAQYGKYQPKMLKLWASSPVDSVDYVRKNWGEAKKQFVYFGSQGWVHRGLDLVIEAFLQTDLKLLICGADDGFLEVYGEEIKKRSNIRYLGFIYPTSENFQQLMKSTCAIVYPSAAEGCSTSVLQCMQFGLIPIVTLATGLSIHQEWPALKGETDLELIADILARCTEISEMPAGQLEELSHSMWNFAHRNHSRQAYRQSLSRVLDELLGE